MKKFTLVLFTLLTLLPLGSWAADYVIGGITFSYTSGSVATVKSVDESATNAEIPAQINVGTTDVPQNINITAIEATAFSGCVNLRTLTIGKNVATIPEGSFKNCSNLTSFSVADDNTNFKDIDGVLFRKDGETLISFPAKKDGDSYSIPSTVTTIYNYAFSGCVNLRTLTIGKNVATIPEGSFKNCSNLTSFSVADDNTNFKDIDGVLFRKDGETLISFPAKKDGDSYSIPSTVTTIYNYAFSGCSNLKSLTVGENVLAIPANLFDDCSSLKTLTIKNTSLLSGSSINSALSQLPSDICIISAGIKYYHHGEWNSANDYFSVGDGTNSTGFDDNTKSGNSLNVLASIGTSTPIPVTTIADNAFYGTASGFSISLPNSITSISALSFASNNLTSFSVADGNTNFEDVEDVLFSKDGKTLISFPTKKDGNSYSVPADVTTIYGYAFSGCTALQEITFSGSTLCEIGEHAFANAATTLTIHFNSIDYKHQGNSWYSGDSFIVTGHTAKDAQDYNILEAINGIHVTEIGNNAMASLDGKNVHIPQHVTTISNTAFIAFTQGHLDNANRLNSITVDEKNSTFFAVGGALYSRKGDEIELITCPTTKSNSGGFWATGVTSIGNNAFLCHRDLSSITIPATVKTIKESAFHFAGANVDGGLTVNFANGSKLTSIGKSAFQRSNVVSMTFPEKLEKIDESAFKECAKLTEVTFPATFKEIGGSAFNGCKLLENVTFSGTSLQKISQSAFYNCKLTSPLTIPDGVVNIEKYAFNVSSDFTSSLSTSPSQVRIPSTVTSIHTDAFPSAVTVLYQLNLTFEENQKWATYYSLEDLEIPDGLEAYAITALSGTEITTQPLHYIHKNEAILIHRTGEALGGFWCSAPTGANKEADNGKSSDSDIFKGSTSGIDLTNISGYKYVLNSDGNFVMTNQGTLSAFRCYLVVPKNQIDAPVDYYTLNADGNSFVYKEEGNYIKKTTNIGSASLSSADANNKITLKVTPIKGFYANLEDITVIRTVQAVAGRAPAIDNNPITLVPTVDDADPSGVTTYTFTHIANATYEVTVNFHKQKSLSDNNIERDIVFTDTGYVYDGEAKTPEISAVKFDGSVVNSKNYTVSYTNNINAGPATIVVTGKREFMNAYSKTFNIAQRNINEVKVKEIADQTYTGATVKPTIVVTDIVKINDSDVDIINKVSGKPDYELEFSDNINVGVAKVNIKALSKNYTGVKTGTTFNILPKNLSLEANKPTIAAVEDQFYTGLAIEPKLDIKDGTIQLTADEDYTVEYNNNIVEGTATIDISFKGNYTGKAQTTFNIKFKEETLTLSNLQFAENCSWTTYYSPIDVKEVTGVKIFVVTGNKNKNGLDLTTQEIPFIPKNVPLLLQHTDASVKTFTGKTMPSSTKLEGVTPDLDLFRGTVSDLDLSTIDGVKFVLQNDKFVQAIEGTLTGNHCYVHLNAEDATDLIIVDDKMAEVVIEEEGKDSPKSGTVTVSSSADDEGYKTITVKPSDKLYATKDEIMVLRYMVAGGAASRRVPAVDNTPVEVQPLSEQADPSKETKYKFKYDSQYKYQIIVNFQKRINLSDKANNPVVTLKDDEKQNLVYDGKEKKPTVESVTCNGTKVDPSNYDITYENNINAGKPKVIITGKGIYMGSTNAEFTIGKRSFDNVTVKLPIPDQKYTGSPIEPVNLVLEDIVDGKNIASVTDCIFDCKNNIEIGTATFSILPKNNYDGRGKGPFTFKIVEATAIEKISVEELEEGQWFTLSGHPLVNKPTQKGVYIFRDKNRKAMKIRIK